MEEENKKAFDFAADLTKQLITLATGVIAIMVTFVTNDSYSQLNKGLLGFSWLFYGLSIITGILTLMALTGNLQPKNPTANHTFSINSDNIRLFSISQIILFLIAILLTAIFGLVSHRSEKKQEDNKNACQIMIYNKVDSIYVKVPIKDSIKTTK